MSHISKELLTEIKKGVSDRKRANSGYIDPEDRQILDLIREIELQREANSLLQKRERIRKKKVKSELEGTRHNAWLRGQTHMRKKICYFLETQGMHKSASMISSVYVDEEDWGEVKKKYRDVGGYTGPARYLVRLLNFLVENLKNG